MKCSNLENSQTPSERSFRSSFFFYFTQGSDASIFRWLNSPTRHNPAFMVTLCRYQQNLISKQQFNG